MTEKRGALPRDTEKSILSAFWHCVKMIERCPRRGKALYGRRGNGNIDAIIRRHLVKNWVWRGARNDGERCLKGELLTKREQRVEIREVYRGKECQLERDLRIAGLGAASTKIRESSRGE